LQLCGEANGIMWQVMLKGMPACHVWVREHCLHSVAAHVFAPTTVTWVTAIAGSVTCNFCREDFENKETNTC